MVLSLSELASSLLVCSSYLFSYLYPVVSSQDTTPCFYNHGDRKLFWDTISYFDNFRMEGEDSFLSHLTVQGHKLRKRLTSCQFAHFPVSQIHFLQSYEEAPYTHKRAVTIRCLVPEISDARHNGHYTSTFISSTWFDLFL